MTHHDHIRTPTVPVVEDVGSGRRRLRRRRIVRFVGATGAVVALVLVVSLVRGGSSGDRQHPAGPSQTQASSTPPARTSGPLVTTTAVDRSMAHLRPGVSEAWAVLAPVGVWGTYRWPDGRDSEPAAADIVTIDVQGFHEGGVARWELRMREHTVPDPVPGEVLEYGVVVDLDGDHAADCQFGLRDDVYVDRARARYTFWVTDYRSGRTVEEVGGPYGRAGLDFAAPDDLQRRLPGRQADTGVSFFWLGTFPGSCGDYASTSSFYAWAAVGSHGKLTAVDYAPDDGWLRMPR